MAKRIELPKKSGDFIIMEHLEALEGQLQDRISYLDKKEGATASDLNELARLGSVLKLIEVAFRVV